MNPRAIAKLRRTFIAIAMASFCVVIAFMGIATLVSNIAAIRQQANDTIDAIMDAGGQMPAEANYHNGLYHEEANYGLRFFVVYFDEEGRVANVDISHVALVDVSSAMQMAESASDPKVQVGLTQAGSFFYKEGPTDAGSMVVFLDCSFQLSNMAQVVSSTLLLSVVAVIITLFSVMFFSRRAIRPEVESARRQQRFMTNASHELKTPIAVIRANTEVTEMISGETEWTKSTLAQVDRLEGLVRDLMTIVRGAERGAEEQELADVDVSSTVAAAVESFRSVAQQSDVGLESSLSTGVSVRGSTASIEQLTCLLVDNAIKYCDAGGSVSVRLSPAMIGRGFTLVVSNDFAEGSDVDYQRFFDRFYREDESHENQQGYGIGLSVAESICKRYHGSIKASWKAGRITFTCVLRDA
ncbi:MAG TPA: hypothetical protein DCP91_10590 [Eggerthellaceae bacterium]|nr:hypothetical protein [Eggerthellaceae bacterium]